MTHDPQMTVSEYQDEKQQNLNVFPWTQQMKWGETVIEGIRLAIYIYMLRY